METAPELLADDAITNARCICGGGRRRIIGLLMTGATACITRYLEAQRYQS